MLAIAEPDTGCRLGPLTPAGGLGQAPVHHHLGQFQADELVVGAQRGGVQLICQPPGRPLPEPPTDGPVRAPGGGDPLTSAAIQFASAMPTL
jgi:hypothetical protein